MKRAIATRHRFALLVRRGTRAQRWMAGRNSGPGRKLERTGGMFMANYDQSGNPAGGRQTPGQQNGSYPSGQAGGRQGSQGQQSQFSAGGGQSQGRGMEQAGARA